MARDTPPPARVGSFLLDVANKRLTWSREMYTILGLDPDEVEPSLDAFLGAIPPEQVPEIRKRLEAGDFLTELSQRRQVVRPNGEVRTVQVEPTQFMIDDRAFIVGAMVDVTDILTDTARARQNEELLVRAQEGASMGTFRWHPETDVGEWSRGMYRILGYEDDVIPCAQAFFARVHPEDTAKFVGAMEAAYEGEVKPVEGRILRPDGEIAHVLISGAVIERGDAPLAWLGTVIDLTERRELEQQLSHAQKMEAIGTLAGGLAHDFNNYLSVVVNNLPLLREDLGEAETALEALADIERASERCRVLTQRLLAFGRKQHHRPRDVDVCWLVESLRGMLDRLVGDHISVQTKTLKTPLCSHIDPNQLEQVVINLVVNARDAMRRGGTVTVFVDAALVDEEHAERHPSLEPGEYVKVVVSDTGSGIPDDVKARVFEPFLTTKDEGTGLGLSTVHGIVEQNGGAVMLQTGDEGTTFVVCLRRCFPERVPVSPPPASSLPPSGVGTILLVEDQPEVRRAARRTLARWGYKVIEKENAEEALALWEAGEERIDLLLSDVQLPGMSGVALAECFRGDEPEIAVILMTGYAPEEVLRSADAPSFTILQKPLGVDELIHAVRSALKK